MAAASQAEALTVALFDRESKRWRRFVAFLGRHDRGQRIAFAPLQDDAGASAARLHGQDPSQL